MYFLYAQSIVCLYALCVSCFSSVGTFGVPSSHFCLSVSSFVHCVLCVWSFFLIVRWMPLAYTVCIEFVYHRPTYALHCCISLLNAIQFPCSSFSVALCKGLPVEFEIDTKLGIKGQQDVLAMGIDKYNAECRGIVSRYTKEWERTVKRMGRWIDFENDYKVRRRETEREREKQ